MSLALYMDEHVPEAVTETLRDRGIDVLTVQEDHRRSAPDVSVLDRASALGRAVVTRDKHFLKEAARRQSAGISFAGIIYSHQISMSVGQFIYELEIVAEILEPPEIANRVIYLPLR